MIILCFREVEQQNANNKPKCRCHVGVSEKPFKNCGVNISIQLSLSKTTKHGTDGKPNTSFASDLQNANQVSISTNCSTKEMMVSLSESKNIAIPLRVGLPRSATSTSGAICWEA